MPAAVPTINGVPGSNADLPINVLVALGNNGAGDELTFTWSILDQPPGAADALSATNIVNPTLTPKKEGTYLLQLIVNAGLPSEKRARVIIGIKELRSGVRVPAAGETTEADAADGWANAVNDALRGGTDLKRNGVQLGVAGAALPVGTVVFAGGVSTIKATLPGQESLPTFSKALATSAADVRGPIGVVESGVKGTTGAGDIIRVRTAGPFGPFALAGAVLGNPVYVSDLGALALAAGTNERIVGCVMWTDGANAWIWLAGDQVLTAGGPAGGILGYPGSTYPNPNGLAALDGGGSWFLRVLGPQDGQTVVIAVKSAPPGMPGDALVVAAADGAEGEAGGAGACMGGSGGAGTASVSSGDGGAMTLTGAPPGVDNGGGSGVPGMGRVKGGIGLNPGTPGAIGRTEGGKGGPGAAGGDAQLFSGDGGDDEGSGGGDSGHVHADVGVPGAGGTAGLVFIGAANANGVVVGRQGVKTERKGMDVLSVGAVDVDDASDTITPDMPYIELENGTGGDVTFTSTPTIGGPGLTGQRLLIVNVDPTYSFTFSNDSALPGSGLKLGAATRTIGPRGSLELIYSAHGWTELNFVAATS